MFLSNPEVGKQNICAAQDVSVCETVLIHLKDVFLDVCFSNKQH